MHTQAITRKFSLRKLLMYVAAIMLLVCVLWGCGQDPAQAASSTNATTQDPVWEEKHLQAMQHADAKEFDQAIAVMTELKEAGYKDAQAEIWALQYQQGEYLLTEKADYAAAAKLFTQLENSGYTDAGEMRQKTYYLWGITLADSGDHVGAYEKLRDIPDYADAAQLLERETEAIYAEGQALYREGNYYEAEKRFLRVSTHQDAKKYITLINARNYPASETLIEGLLAIFTFEDASQVLLHDHELASIFLMGTWISQEGYYFLLTERYYHCTLPQVNIANSLSIDGGVFYFSAYGSSEKEPVFDVTVVTPNCINISSRVDKKS